MRGWIDPSHPLAFGLPDRMGLNALGKDRAEHLASLGQKYRYNLRKEAIAHEQRFEVDTSKNVSESSCEGCPF